MITAPAVAFVLVLLTAPLAIRALRRRGVVDVPNDRSSHVAPTPRGGGIAPLAGLVVALLAAADVDWSLRAPLVLAAVIYGAIGFAEDLVGVRVSLRLMLQAGTALVLTPWLVSDLSEPLPERLLVVLLAAGFLVAHVNAFNFMDGINGISAAQAAVAGIAWWVVGRSAGEESFAIAGAIVAAAALGFVPYNFPRASVFLGDVGSYAFGGVLAALAVAGMRRGIAPEAVVAPLAVYLADTGATLVRRVTRGEPWARPHRDHTYQQLVRLGWSHQVTTLVVAAVCGLVAGMGAVPLAWHGTAVRLVADLAIGLTLVAYLRLPTVVRKARSVPALI